MTMKHSTGTIVTLLAAVATAAAMAAGAARSAADSSTPVVVPRGQPIRVAFANDLTGYASSYGVSFANALRMAVAAHPAVRGFPVQIDTFDEPCGDPTADVAAATSIAGDGRYVGVLGQLCSFGFDQALPVYEAAGIVTISGSATDDALPSFGPTVFNRTAVDNGDGFDSWYAAVTQVPSDLAWQQAYALQFGSAPFPYADLYYDAASLLIRDLQKTATLDSAGNLVINRAALAQAVRNTTRYQGVTCTITFDPTTGNRRNDPVALSRCAAGE